MMLDERLGYAFLLLFVRSGVLLVATPVFGGFGIPARVRVGLGLMVAIALAPTLRPWIGTMPGDFLSFIGAMAKEAAIGLMIGSLLQVVLLAAQTAGHFIDLQIGFAIMRLLNPPGGFPVSVLGQLKGYMAMTLFLVVNGHHLVFKSLAASYYYTPAVGMAHLETMQAVVVDTTYRLFLLALQIAAPAATVAFITDASLAAVSRAVPQVNVLIVGFPAKILLGLFGVMVGMPVLLWGVRESLQLSSDAIAKLLLPAGGP